MYAEIKRKLNIILSIG